MTEPDTVLHVDLIALAGGVTDAARTELLAAARALIEIDGVRCIGAIEADAGSAYDIAVCFVLDSFGVLEPFGTDPRYVRFLQGTVAPLLRGFAGADVRLESEWPLTADDAPAHAACLALEAPEETYDWEVRDRLSEWTTVRGGSSVIGLAVGERQRFRGLALAFDSKAPTADTDSGANATVAGRWR